VFSYPRRPKLFRDPIHDVISYDLDTEFGRTLVRLIDSQPMQRLRHIRQLGLAYFVYHGAEHSRFSHSMGCAYFCDRMFQAIHRGEKADPMQRLAVCAAGLLHDVGHAPFSHALESTLQQVLGFEGEHEDFTRRIILWEEGEIYQALHDVAPELPRKVADIISHKSGSYTEPIVSSQLDADRMDYLIRDGYMTGVQNYHYDAGRILEMLMHDEHGLVVSHRALQAVESYLLSRFHMYQQVYYHKTVRAAEAQVESVFRRVLDLLRADDMSVLPDNPLGRLFNDALHRRQPLIEDYVRIDEHHAWESFHNWAHHPDPVLSTLCRGFEVRRLFKTVEIPRHQLQSFLETSRTHVDDLVRDHGFDPTYFTALDMAEETPLDPYEPPTDGLVAALSLDVEAPNTAIRIHMGGGRIEPIEAVSEVAMALSRIRYRVYSYCVPLAARAEVLELVRARHGELESTTFNE